MIFHFDTTFLVDLLRETARGESGPASSFLDSHLEDEFRMAFFVACELHVGAERSAHPERERRRVRELCSVVPVVFPTAAYPAVYGRLLADLQRRGQVIATMDLMIGTTALVEGAPLVTRNERHFSRLKELLLFAY